MFVAVLFRVHRSLAFAFVMLSCAIANAQPQPGARSDVPFDPIDRSGWPVGLSLDDLRELPECGIEGLSHVPGAAVTCRPPVIAGPVQWALGLDWTSGGTFGDVPTIGAAHALGVELDFGVLRTLQLGVRYELMGIGLPSTPAFEASTGLSNQFFGLAKKRFFTDEVRRNAWTLGIGGGYAIRRDDLGGSAPMLRGSIAREVGMSLGDQSALTYAFEIAYEQSLGPTRIAAVLASLRLGFEVGIREPEGLGRPAPKEWRHTTSFETYAGPYLGFGMSLGLRATSSLSLETTAGFLFGFSSADHKEHGLDGAAWSLQTGPRLLLPWPADYVPLYLQLQGGAAWIAHDPRGELRAIATGELGFHAFAGCGGAVDLGFWLRADIEQRELTAGGFVLRAMIGSGTGAAGGHREDHCGGREVPHLAMPYVPPPPTTTTTTTTSQTYTVDLNPPNITVPNVDVHVGGTVEVPKPQPIVLDVELGAVFFGMQVRIDPRLLPFDRLRGAGWISIELTGPADALVKFQSELSATLSRGKIRVDGWSNVVTSDSVVRARFTIWPPGSRP
jgi:hypothetical protein